MGVFDDDGRAARRELRLDSSRDDTAIGAVVGCHRNTVKICRDRMFATYRKGQIDLRYSDELGDIAHWLVQDRQSDRELTPDAELSDATGLAVARVVELRQEMSFWRPGERVGMGADHLMPSERDEQIEQLSDAGGHDNHVRMLESVDDGEPFNTRRWV